MTSENMKDIFINESKMAIKRYFFIFFQLENILNNIFIYEGSIFLRMGIFIFFTEPLL